MFWAVAAHPQVEPGREFTARLDIIRHAS